MESAEHNITNKNIEVQSLSNMNLLHHSNMFFIQFTAFENRKLQNLNSFSNSVVQEF